MLSWLFGTPPIQAARFTYKAAWANIALRSIGRKMEAKKEDLRWMEEALHEASKAAACGEVPVGALVVRQGQVLGRAFNRREASQDPLDHAEMLVIREAAKALGSWRLVDCTMYVTLEPCAMCAGALVNSRIERLVFGASDPKAGFCGSLGDLVTDVRLNHRLKVRGGILEPACRQILKEFFGKLRRC